MNTCHLDDFFTVLIFQDDISLFAAANVCKRWYQILVSQTNSEQWKVITFFITFFNYD